MTITDIFNRSLKQVKRNSPEILTGLSIVGVLVTGVLAARAALKAKEVLDQNPQSSKKDEILAVWPVYIPPVLSGAATITCIITGNKAAGNRTAAAVAAYSITERAFTEYKEHVAEQIGKGKEQKIRDEIAQKRITNNPPEENRILVVGRGEVLCCELWTGRYFKSDVETLRRAENEINHMLNSSAQLGVTLSEFYDILDLPHTSESDHNGWDSDKMMELQFSAVLTPEHEPCMAFEYNYLRSTDRNKYN